MLTTGIYFSGRITVGVLLRANLYQMDLVVGSQMVVADHLLQEDVGSEMLVILLEQWFVEGEDLLVLIP